MDGNHSKKFLNRAFVKTVLRRTFTLIALVGFIYGLTAVVYATRTIFKVKMNYAPWYWNVLAVSARRSPRWAGM